MKPIRLLLATLLPLLLQAADKPTVEQLFNVQTVQVEKTTEGRSQTNYGYVRAEASRTYDVAPRFGGYVQTLFADTRYLRVKKGDALARVYSPEVLQAKEDYLTALRFNARSPNPGMVRSVREKLKLLGVSPAEIAAVRKTMKADPLTTVRAPESGWIFEKNVRLGSAFKKGTKLFTIVDLSRVWVEASIYQTQLPLLPSMETFSVRATGVDRDFKATRKLLYPDIDPKAATATLRLEVDNPECLLLPGMYATITSSAASESVLTLPRTAVIRKNGAWYVFRAGDFKGVYDPVKVDAVPLDKTHYEIRSGLHAGDVVADNALFMMDSDAQINGLY